MASLFDWWKKKPQRDAARNQLRLEVAANHRMLEEYWSKVKPRKSDEESHWVDKVVYARGLTDSDLPKFSLDAYSRLKPHLSDYLRGNRLKQLVQFYEALDRLVDIQKGLRRELEKDLALRRLPGGIDYAVSAPSPKFENFLQVAPWLWRDAARLIEETLTLGNPLYK